MRSLPRVIKACRVRLTEDRGKRTGDRGRGAEEKSPAGAGADLECAEQARDELLSLARGQASQTLEEAREEAHQLTRQAEREAGALRERIRQEAYRQGLEQAAQETAELLARGQAEIDEILREAHRQRDATLDSLEPRIFKLALETAEKIMGYELDHNEKAFLSMLSQALTSVKNESRVTLRVNPGEYVRFFKSREVTMHTPNGALKAEVVSDPTVGYGGCVIETESGDIDAGAAAQLSQIQRNLGLEGD